MAPYACLLLFFTTILFPSSYGQPGALNSCEYYCRPTSGPRPTIKCISWSQRCNGVKDCWDAVDEKECDTYRPRTEPAAFITEELTTEVPHIPESDSGQPSTNWGSQTGTTGDYFVFAWPDTVEGTSFKISMITADNRTAQVNISMPGNRHGWRENLVVRPRENTEQLITQDMVSMTQTDLDFVSLEVRSDIPISVTALSVAPSGPSDSFRVIPAANLGTEYFVPLIYANLHGTSLAGVATISTLSEAARVSVGFEHDVLLGTESVDRGVAVSKTVKAFQTFQAKVNVSGNDSVTVMRVTSDKPVAVVSGSICGRIPPDGNQSRTCEYLVEQFPPFKQWGRNFIVPHFVGRRGYSLMVIAGRDDTSYSKDGEQFVLQQGEHEFFTYRESNVTNITASKPIMVVLFSKSWYVGEEGDASMTLVPPLEQYVRGKQTFHVIQPSKQGTRIQNYIALTAPCESIDNFLLDGMRLDTINVSSDDDDQMCIYNSEIKPGIHDVWQESGDDPYMVMSYGFKARVGYGYLVGFNARNITCQTYDDLNDASSEYDCDELTTDICPAGNISTDIFTLTWPDTKIFRTTDSTEVCPLTYSKAGLPIASRRCILTEDLQAVWQDPIEYGCGTVISVEKPEDLVNVTVTEQNVEEVSQTLNTVTREIDTITSNDVIAVTETLTKVVETGSTSLEVTESVVQTMDSVLLELTEAEASEDFERGAETATSTSDMVLLMEQQIQQALTEQTTVRITQEVIQVQAFHLDPVETEEDLVIQPERQQPSDEHTSVLLPMEIFHAEEETTVSVSFVMYRDDALFQPPPETLRDKVPPEVVLSVSVSSYNVEKLTKPILLNFPVPEVNNTNSSSVTCVFWDFDMNNGSGDWSGKGCEHTETSNQSVTCSCDHLTNFAVLMDYMDGVEDETNAYYQMLDILTKIGCAVSIIGLSVTLIVFAFFKRLRTSRPRRILVHLCVALLCLYITFLFGIDNAHQSSWGCPLVAAMIHYFLLSAVCWMGVEALNIYLMLVRVFSMNVSKFVLKGALFAWGAPLLVVGICVGVATEQYSVEHYCFLTQGTVLYIALITPMALILIHNIVVFILVFRNLMTSNIAGTVHGKKTDMDLLKERLQNALTMTVLMGLTWSFGFLMVGHAKFVFQLLFCLFNSFQGLVVFIIFCWRQEDVRKILRPHCRKVKRKGKEVVGPHADYEVTSTAAGHNTTRVSADVRKNVTSTGSTSETLLLSPQKTKVNNNTDGTTFV